jgi:hypothetical protein
MKPIVILGMVQPYPGYGCEQVTIVASRNLDMIVAFGQTRHTMYLEAISSICNLKMLHALVTRNPFITVLDVQSFRPAYCGIGGK